jgi:hypothetical protein
MSILIESKFDVLNNNRPDNGNGRLYQIDNVSKIIEQSQWQVNQKQMLGYYGHPNSLLLKENMQNQPSNVCTRLRLNGSIVEHSQQILETDTGKVVAALHKAGAGGWSWRAGGTDGGREAPTEIRELAGFDYVHSPSFTAITESVEGRDEELRKIRHHLIDEGLSKDFANQFVEGMNDNVAKEIQQINEDRNKLQTEVANLKEALRSTSEYNSQLISERREILRETLREMPYNLKSSVLDILAEGITDAHDVRFLLKELTAYQSTDMNSLPLSDKPITEVVRDKMGFLDESEVNFDFNSLFERK